MRAGVALVNEVLFKGFKRAIEFRKAIADMAAISGQSVESLQGLSDTIKNIASSTTFTVKEIAQFSKEMFKLGFSINEVESSMTTIAKTAQALGVGISEVGKTVGKTLNAFGLGFSESGRVTNTLVGAINTSALSFESFNTAMQYVAPVARAANVSLEETTALMALLADSGFKASKIGTGLRGVFLKLGGASSDLIGDLKELSEANLSLAAAEELVGVRAAAQFLTLLNGIETIDETAKSYEELDKVNRAAAKQMDTDVERIKALGVAWDLFTQKIGGSIAASNIMLDLLGVLDKDARNYLLAQRALYGEKGGIGSEAFEGIINANTDEDGVVDKQQAAIDAYIASLKKAGVDITAAEEEFIDKVAKDPSELTPLNYFNLPSEVSGDEIRESVAGLFDSVDRELEEKTKSRLNKKGRAATFKTLFGIPEPEDFKISDIVTPENYAEYQNIIDRRIRYTKQKSDSSKVGSDSASYYEGATSEAKELKTQLVQLNAEWIKEDEIRTEAAEKRKKEADEELARRLAEMKALRDVEAQIVLYWERVEERNDLESNLALFGIPLDGTETIAHLKDLTKQLLAAQEEALDESNKILETNNAIEALITDPLELAIQENYDTFQTFIEFVKKQALEGWEEVVKALEDAREAKAAEITTKSAGGSKGVDDSIIGKMLGIDGDTVRALKIALNAAVNAVSDILIHANRQKLEQARDEATAQIAVIREQYDVEEQLLRSKLDRELITEQQYEAAREKLAKDVADKENAILKQKFEAEREYDKKQAASRFAQSLGTIVINNLTAKGVATPVAIALSAAGVAAAGIAYGTELDAINSRTFQPTRFATGGMIGGNLHSSGGTLIEAERDEYIINRGSTYNNLGLVKAINDNPNVSFESQFKAMTSTLMSIDRKVGAPKQSYITDKDMRETNTRERIHRQNISL